MATYTLQLISHVDECRALHDYLVVLAEREEFSQEFLYELELVVKEAFVNAVRHGNSGNEAATVNLRVESLREDSGRILLIEVADSGKGFAIHEIDNPTAPSLLMKSSGRGVFLIRAFAEIIGQERDEEGWRLRLKMMPY